MVGDDSLDGSGHGSKPVYFTVVKTLRTGRVRVNTVKSQGREGKPPPEKKEKKKDRNLNPPRNPTHWYWYSP